MDDKERWEDRANCDGGAQRFLIAHNEDLPYGAEGEEEVFPGPPPDDDGFAQYIWTGPTGLQTVRGMHIHAGRDTLGHADRYGLYLANTLWALLDFGGWLSRGLGLMLYESILDDITIYVDGEPRPRFGMDDLLLSFLKQPEPPKPSRTLTPEVAAALKVWKEWVVKWRTWRKLRDSEGCSGSAGVLVDDTCMEPEPRPSFDAFVRYLPASTWDYDPNEPEYSDLDSDFVSEDDADASIAEE